jgi:hypothetical protein
VLLPTSAINNNNDCNLNNSSATAARYVSTIPSSSTATGAAAVLEPTGSDVEDDGQF